jgi:hypothetical protein
VRWVVGGALLVGVLGLVVGLRLARLSRDLDSARGLIDVAAVALEDGRLADARGALREAQGLLVESNDTLFGAPDLQVVSLFPVARQNVDALRDTVGVALRLTAGGLRTLEASSTLEGADGRLEIPLQEGAVPLEVVADAQVELAALSSSLVLPDHFGAERTFVLGPITDAQQQVRAEVERRQPQVATLEQGLSLLQELLGGNGDRRYLIAVANTAEMRGSGGMYLSYGVLESSGGDLHLGSFGGIDDLFLTEAVDPVALGVPETELSRWPGLEPTRLWRNVNLVPDFAVVAPRAMAMYEAAAGQPVDGVIQIDPAGLGAILAGIGPVPVAGVGTVTSENVVALTLNEAYSLFPDRDQRQEVLGDVAEAVFQRLVDGDYPSLRPLATSLAEAVAGHHVLLDTPHPGALAALAFFDASGTLPAVGGDDYFLLTTQNRGRDKLDFYLDTSVSIAGERPEADAGVLDVEVRFDNTAPAGQSEPAYVFGGDVVGEVDLGTYTGIVSLYVPNGAQLVAGSTPAPPGATVVAEGDRTAVTWEVAVPAATTQTFHLQLRLPPRPPGPYRLHLSPVPRVRPTQWEVDVDDGTGASATRSGPLERTEVVAAP